MVILLGLLGGKLSHHYKIPKVTGYMVTGLIFGPSVLGLISTTTLNDIQMINDIALGLILFAIGGEIEFRHLKSMGKKVIFIALAESFASFLLVSAVVLLVTSDLKTSLLLGAISIATAPGVTLLVIREYRARGVLTDTLLAVVAINNILCLVTFQILFTFLTQPEGAPILSAVGSLAYQFILSILVGGAIGALITLWEQKIDDLSELLLVIIGGLLLGIGAAVTLDFSPLIVCLIIGAVTNNLSMMHRLVYAELRQTEMPFYIAFFVLSGAHLELVELSHLGLLGLAYLVARPLAKYVGAYFVGKHFKADPNVTKGLGMALLPQAGVAIGMVMVVNKVDAELGALLGAVILSSVVVYESVGPFLTRLALSKAGEIHLQE